MVINLKWFALNPACHEEWSQPLLSLNSLNLETNFRDNQVQAPKLLSSLQQRKLRPGEIKCFVKICCLETTYILWDFLGSPVAKMPCFHCTGHGFNPSQGTKISSVMWHGQKGKNTCFRFFQKCICPVHITHIVYFYLYFLIL